jgi:TRAP-type C4-dicarboxylate transport system substrate-binding protein
VTRLSAFCQLSLLLWATTAAHADRAVGRADGAERNDTIVLRLASVAPDGTAWAREFKAFAREVAAATQNQVQIKWYLGGIAGDELRQHERVQRDQLDGIISGGMLCQRLAPSMRGMTVAGQFHDRDEAAYVLARLRPAIDAELLGNGYMHLADSSLGFTVIFSRTPIHSLADLRRMHPWLWSLDDVLIAQLSAAGLHPIVMPIDAAARAYDEGRVDGFLAVPSAAMAFQWSAQARYVVSDLRVAFLVGCMMVARRAWDTLGHDDQQVLLSAAGKLAARVEAVSQDMDESLLKTLFPRQGMTVTAAPAPLQSEFAEAVRAAKPALAGLVPAGVAARITAWLAEVRSHRASRR